MAHKTIEPKVKKLVEDYIRVLENDHLPIEEVYIFGSRVTGKARWDSDVDVAIVSSKLHNSLSSTKYLLKKAHQLKSPSHTIEPHGFHSTDFVDDNPVVWEIKTTGIQIRA